MSAADDIADVLNQVVSIGPSAQESELGAAVSDQIRSRQPRPAPGLALRPEPGWVVHVNVDFTALLDTYGEPRAWDILSRLHRAGANGATP